MKNKLNIKTKYKVKILFDDYSSVNDILTSYYLPLIRSEAFALYSALTLDSRNNSINTVFISIERIISMINLSIEEIENAIIKLELVNLLSIYSEKNNKIVFELLRPLSPKDFNESFQFSELLTSSAGKDNFDINNKLFNSLKNIDINQSQKLTESIELKTNSIKDLNISYDFDLVKSVLIAKGIDWNSFWNEEVEKVILDLIIIYKISAFDIAIEIIKQLEIGLFNSEQLQNSVKNSFIKEKDISSIINSGDKTTEIKLNFLKELEVKDYFITRLNRLPSNSESEMVIKLKREYGFSNNIINILVDYSILVNNGAVNQNYILKISETLKKEGIDTSENVIQYLRVSYKMKKTKKTKKTKDIINNEEMKDKPIF